MKNPKFEWKKYLFEFLSIFIAVMMAFGLSKWNENNNDRKAERKTLLEISNGLKLDIQDIKGNLEGHKRGVQACQFMKDLVNDKPVYMDSLKIYYFVLFRDFVSVQNQSGYQSLRSRGLELIQNDSLRVQIVNLYDFYFEILEKLEENYSEMQNFQSYFLSINNILSPYQEIDENGTLLSITQPLKLTISEKNQILYSLARIEFNRKFMIQNYIDVQKKAEMLIDEINSELKP